ncbi:MAG: chitobiase/beta-hexosaminidase C-terminal domain-containing protein [Candidatus Cloacimonetes bacterium]|nr:chitobiase/beta-hexosaminidase C-terminal domain-containing protein [Candidatus Cloacimonadota bacterium]
MKKILIIFTIMLLSVVLFADTYLETFETDGNWAGGAMGSYTAKTYTNSSDPANDVFSSDNAVRETTYIRPSSPFAWRLGSGSYYFSYECYESVSAFSMWLARWDNSPAISFTVRYSLDSGSSYTDIETLPGTWFSADKVYQQYTYTGDLTPGPGEKLIIAIVKSGERFMIDDFSIEYAAAEVQYPVISNVDFLPTAPTPSESVTVTATITDGDGTISSAYVNWGTETGVYPNQEEMTADGDTYEAVIPAQTNGTTVYFEIEATDNDTNTSMSSEYDYTTALPVVETPTFDPVAGTYSGTQSVEILCNTAEASIYYTTDGSDPDDLSTPYTVAFSVSTTTTVKAIAYKTDYTPSAIATAVYTILVGPESAGVIISEVADPTDYNAAYIELYNAGTTPVNLRGWSILQYNSSQTTIFDDVVNTDLVTNMTDDYTLHSGEYVVLIRGTLVDFLGTYPTFVGNYFVDGTNSGGVPQINGAEYFELYDNNAKAIVDRMGSSSNTISADRVYERNDALTTGVTLGTDWTVYLASSTPGTPDEPNIVPLANDEAILPVELTSFAATAMTSQGDNMFVRLEWTVESESNLAGYNVHRSSTESEADSYLVNGGLITAENTSTAHSYRFDDAEIEVGGTFYYWLESVSLDGINNFYGPVSVLVEDEDEPGTPDIVKFNSLKSIYPNPFNPSTSITFSLKEDGQATVKVYNVKGEFITEVANGSYPSGVNHTVVWNGLDHNGRSCGSGIYFFKMEANGFTATRKAVLVK